MSKPLDRSWIARFAVPAIHLLAATTPSSARAPSQPPRPTNTTPADLRALRPVEAGATDVNPLSVGRAITRAQLRVPTAFEQVYQLNAKSGPMYARVNGGVTAVFPRSAYVRIGDTNVAEIPPGTIFYVGKIPDAFFGGGVGGVGSKRLPPALGDTYPNAGARREHGIARGPIDLRAPVPQYLPQGSRIEAGSAFSVFENEVYRQRRLNELLDRAAQAQASEAKVHTDLTDR